MNARSTLADVGALAVTAHRARIAWEQDALADPALQRANGALDAALAAFAAGPVVALAAWMVDTVVYKDPPPRDEHITEIVARLRHLVTKRDPYEPGPAGFGPMWDFARPRIDAFVAAARAERESHPVLVGQVAPPRIEVLIQAIRESGEAPERLSSVIDSLVLRAIEAGIPHMEVLAALVLSTGILIQYQDAPWTAEQAAEKVIDGVRASVTIFAEERGRRPSVMRGGPERCPRPCSECSAESHHFSSVIVAFAESDDPDDEDNSQHPAALAGHGLWHPCKHCDAWRAELDESDDPDDDNVESDRGALR